MDSSKNATLKCPFCSWCKRTYYLPDHLITHHANEIRIRPVTTDHCVYAYVLHKKEEIGFCVCLTCKKGTVGDGVSGNTSRWVELHAKKTECKKPHRARLAELKEVIGTAAPVTPSIIPAPKPPNSVGSLWDKLRTNHHLIPFMKEIEAGCQEFHEEEDGEFVFDPTEAFENALKSAVGYRKDTLRFNEEKNKMETDHDSELATLRCDIMVLQNEVRCLRRDNSDQTHEIDELRARVTMLERQNKRYKEACPSLVAEDPQ